MAQATGIRITIDGHAIEAPSGSSLIQAWIAPGLPLTGHVGCMGQGVCGACRILVRREGERIATAALACETRAEDGMQVAFADHFPAHRTHAYDLDTLGDSCAAIGAIDKVFPEARHCGHCGCCDAACPEHIAPAHLGQFLRRMSASLTLRPSDLVLRLQEIERGRQPIDIDAPQPEPAP